MKKLMTLLSAATVAIGLQAADYTDTGTSFEGAARGAFDITTADDLGSNVTGLWSTNGSDTVTLEVTDDQSCIRPAPGSTETDWPWQYNEWSQTNSLAIKTTFGNPVTRKVQGTGYAFGLDDRESFYFDSFVKFTAFDDDPMNTAVTNDFGDAKIAVWAQEVTLEGGALQTNVFVRAGYIGGQPQNYNCGRLNDPEGWHRLTIKFIKNVYYLDQTKPSTPCFVVFVDGGWRTDSSANKRGLDEGLQASMYAGFYNTGALFPSLDQATPDKSGLKSVSFDGQGSIDDLVFTKTAPFAAAGDGTDAVATFNGKSYSTMDALVAAVNDATADDLTTNTVKIFSNYTDEPLAFENNTGATIKIDLNGKTLAGISTQGLSPAWIIDTSAGQTGVVSGYFSVGENSIIEAGTYNGGESDVSIGVGTEFRGGRFSTNGCDVATLNSADYTRPEGKEFVLGTGDDAGYFVLGNAPSYVAANPWYENPAAIVLAENLPAQTGDSYVSAFHGQGSGNYLGLTYSTNPLQFDLFDVDGTNALTTITSVENTALTTPGFRGVAISEALGIAMTLRYKTETKLYAFPLAGGDPTEVTTDQDIAFDAGAFSPDGLYFFGNKNPGSDGPEVSKWSVSNGGTTLTYLGEKTSGARLRTIAYARINNRDLVFGLNDSKQVVAIDASSNNASDWTVYVLATLANKASYGTLCVSGVNAVNSDRTPATPHLTVATSLNGASFNSDLLNVYALTVPASGAVSASLVKSFDEAAMTAAGFGDISGNRYGNTVYVTDDEKYIYFARPDQKLYVAQFAEARIGDTLFDTLKDAVDAADTGDTVTVCKNCSVTNGNVGITFTKGINLVNNYTITIDGANYALRIANGTTTPVTLSGTGSLVWANGSGSPILVGCNEIKSGYGITAFCQGSFVLNGGTLTSTDKTAKGGNLVKLEDGTFVLNDGTINGGTRGVKADSEGNNATCVLTINGGTIVNTNSAAIAASTAGSGSSTVTVNGGTFTGAIVGNGMVTIPGTSTAKFDRDQSAFCVEGYETTLSDGWYVVTPKQFTITYKYGETTLSGLTPTNYTVEAAVTLPSEVDLGVVGVGFQAWTNAAGAVVAAWAAGDKTGDQTFYAQVTIVTLGTEPGGTIGEYDDAAAATNAANNAAVAVPAAVAAALTIEQQNAYKLYFHGKVGDYDPASGKYPVTMELAPGEPTQTIQGTADAAVTAAAAKLSDVATAQQTVAVGAVAGFYYSIESGTEVNNLAEPQQRTLATGDTVELTMPTLGAKGFYRVKVSVEQLPTPPNE